MKKYLLILGVVLAGFAVCSAADGKAKEFSKEKAKKVDVPKVEDVLGYKSDAITLIPFTLRSFYREKNLRKITKDNYREKVLFVDFVKVYKDYSEPKKYIDSLRDKIEQYGGTVEYVEINKVSSVFKKGHYGYKIVVSYIGNFFINALDFSNRNLYDRSEEIIKGMKVHKDLDIIVDGIRGVRRKNSSYVDYLGANIFIIYKSSFPVDLSISGNKISVRRRISGTIPDEIAEKCYDFLNSNYIFVEDGRVILGPKMILGASEKKYKSYKKAKAVFDDSRGLMKEKFKLVGIVKKAGSYRYYYLTILLLSDPNVVFPAEE